jgi:dolichyl-diphosphooligosaccharide--protein glycosyltransferase
MTNSQPLLKEFDPYFFYYNVQYIISHGFPAWFSWMDYTAWYPFGRDVAGSTYPGMVFTAVLLYYFINGIGIATSAFTVCYYMPVLFGTLTPLVLYLIGKESYDRRSGLLAAFFIAVSPAIIQRQVVGFFDNDPFGMFIMLVSIYFFIRSLKRGSVSSGIMAGLFLGYICISWGTYRYALDIYALFAAVMLITRHYSSRLYNTYTLTVLPGLFIAVLAPRNGLGILGTGEVLPVILVLALMMVYETSKFLGRMKIFARISNRFSTVNPFLLGAVVAVGGLIILTISPIGGKFYTVIMPIFRETQTAILASVGEHQPTPWASFFYYIGIILVLSVAGVYFSFKRLSEADIFIILATITLAYFAGSMVRIVITLSPFLALLAGYGLSSVLKPFGKIMAAPKEEIIHRKRIRTTPTVSREYAALAFLVIGMLLFTYGNTIITYSPHSTTTMIEGMAPPEITPAGLTDWLQAMSWLNNQAPPGAVVVAWWDYGYYITIVGNRTSVDDNATTNSTQIAWVGLGFMQTNETSALEIFKRFHADYALVYFGFMQAALGGDEGKWIWMLRIAANNFPDMINTTQYYNDTSSVTYPLFFNTTLYRLMFDGEPSANTQLAYSLVFSMGTAASPYRMISTQNFPAVAPDANTLSGFNSQLQTQYGSTYGFSPVTTIDQYGPLFFQKAFFSSNRLVKIYKIDYTPLEMQGNLAINASATHVYKNGTAIITAENIGASSTPAIPLNFYTDSTGRLLVGTVSINGTQVSSLEPMTYWNSATSSWQPTSTTYYLNPGQSVQFKINGINTNMLQTAYNMTQSLPLRLFAAYDRSINTQILISVENS